jgi:hypothetical protein
MTFDFSAIQDRLSDMSFKMEFKQAAERLEVVPRIRQTLNG